MLGWVSAGRPTQATLNFPEEEKDLNVKLITLNSAVVNLASVSGIPVGMVEWVTAGN